MPETKQSKQPGPGALEGITVLDLTRVLAGPFCGMILADMGANVIKIEEPSKGDDSRQFVPFVNGESSYYMNLNRNKRGITLNLKDPKGKEIFLKLLKKADVVLENFRTGVMDKLGFSYEELKKHNPRIVYAAVTGFGHYGPYKDRAGYDIISQAMGGLMSTTGWPDGPPTRTGTAMGDILAGLSVTIGILAALQNRERTGEGQKIDVALVDSVVASLEIINQIYLSEGRVPTRIGNRYESVYPYDSFEVADGYIVIGCGNDKLWQNLCALMGDSELAANQDFAINRNRVARHSEIRPIVERWTRQLKTKEILEQLVKAGIPCAPIYTIDQVVADPHISKAREMFVEIEHPKAGKTRLTGSHIKMSATNPGIRTPAPLLGQHNEEVLGSFLGMDAAEIKNLKAEKVI
jgi:crotonobetainyl-CoA:carnitine CoA-transferase CaiB-like acyl-CoA transferase